MIYRSATKPVQLFANFGGALLVGLFFAFVVLGGENLARAGKRKPGM